MLDERSLFRVRIGLIQAYLREKGHDGILLTRPDNFAMATGGKRNYIWTYSDAGANSLFVDKQGAAYFVGNTIEEPRVMAEELAGIDCAVKDFLWFEDSAASVARKAFTGDLVSDDGSLGANVNGELAVLRSLLTVTELEKYRRLGALAAESMMATLEAIRPGMAEQHIAGTLIAEGQKRGCQVPVALIAADDRIRRFRHPLPTVAPLLGGVLKETCVSGYVMVVGCFMREGLVVSMTRFKMVAEISATIRDAYHRICCVDAEMQEASRPGNTLGDVFTACQKAYAHYGFAPNEWHNHHQGGATGYAGRTAKGAPDNPHPVLDTHWPATLREITGEQHEFGAAFAWNPSAPGVKSEDTFLLWPDGRQEIVSQTPALPQVDLGPLLGRATSILKSGFA